MAAPVLPTMLISNSYPLNEGIHSFKNQKLFLKMELATLQSSIFYAFVYATFPVVHAQKREFYTAFIYVVFDVIKVFFHFCMHAKKPKYFDKRNLNLL